MSEAPKTVIEQSKYLDESVILALDFLQEFDEHDWQMLLQESSKYQAFKKWRVKNAKRFEHAEKTGLFGEVLRQVISITCDSESFDSRKIRKTMCSEDRSRYCPEPGKPMESVESVYVNDDESDSDSEPLCKRSRTSDENED